MDKDIWQSEYYAVPKMYMKLTGIWPYQKIREKILFFVPIFTLSFSIFIPQVYHIIYCICEERVCLFSKAFLLHEKDSLS